MSTTTPAGETASPPPWRERAFAWMLYPLPHHALSSVVHWATRIRWRPFRKLLIRWFVHHYGVDLSEAAEDDPGRYDTFNAFFVRALKPQARPLAGDAGTVACPVDGHVSQLGSIRRDTLLQAKGHSFLLNELLAGSASWVESFRNGSFATLYLSPRDYHRIHMPCTGRLERMVHVPGRLFSVSPVTTRTIPRLFARNERLVNLFDTDAGPMAVIMVGAIFVASMETAWSKGVVTPAWFSGLRDWAYNDPSEAPALERGDELGRFNMGSTVILLFARDRVRWLPELKAGDRVKMGQAIGNIR